MVLTRRFNRRLAGENRNESKSTCNPDYYFTTGNYLAAFSARAGQHAAQPKADPISGEWDAAFESQTDANSFALELKLKLEGEKVVGTYKSAMSEGKLTKGVWAANKLSLAFETPHGTVVFSGKLNAGKLTGEFDAGHMKGNWEAKKK